MSVCRVNKNLKIHINAFSYKIRVSISQNAWDLKNISLNRQKRRSELVRKCIPKITKKIIDIGCAEGFMISYMINDDKSIVGIESNFDNLRTAKQKTKGVFYLMVHIDFYHF